MPTQIQLIAGLGNPGLEYTKTRHNAGAWLVEILAGAEQQTLRLENKFSGLCSKIKLAGETCHLLIPTTFMNHSGQAVQALANFYRIDPAGILIVHDELDLPVGIARFKEGGGDGGHNGLRSITACLNTNQYWRLRIGIGHPGDRNRVHDYVLSKPSQDDHDKIIHSIENALAVLSQFVQGQTQKAIQQLHTKLEE